MFVVKASTPTHLAAPIGLFDSGIGGLSVYLHLAQQLPNEQYIYYADTQNVPYGTRSSEEIYRFTLRAVDWLYNQGCKLIVIACNSASAHALEAARAAYPNVPIVGLVPALKPAVLASQSKHVAVLATQATLNGKLLNQVIEDIADPANTNVTKCFDPELVPWIEAGMPLQDKTALSLSARMRHFHQLGVDHLVLGCTHYPFFKPLLEAQIAQEQLNITIVDSGAAIAARVQQLLSAEGQVKAANTLASTKCQCTASHATTDPQATLADQPIPPKLKFYASQYDAELGELVQTLVQQPVELLNEVLSKNPA